MIKNDLKQEGTPDYTEAYRKKKNRLPKVSKSNANLPYQEILLLLIKSTF